MDVIFQFLKNLSLLHPEKKKPYKTYSMGSSYG